MCAEYFVISHRLFGAFGRPLARFITEVINRIFMITAIRNAWIVTQDESRRILKGDVVIDGERIVSVGPAYDGTADREIDATGDIVMPGMINTHTHVAMSVMKGVVDDLTFPDFLDKVFKIDSDRTDEDLALGTKLGCMEMMRGGTTTFMDLYYSEDVIARATQEAGIRGVLCWCVLDQECTTQKGNPLQNCKDFYRRFKDERKIVPGVGLQGVYVCNEETWSTCATRRPAWERRSSPTRSGRP